MIPNSLSIHSQVIFCTLKYLLKLCQTRCTTTNHLCQITHHQFWNGKCWTPARAAATVRLQEASERSKLLRSCCWKLPPPSFPGQCHGGLKVMITQLPLRTFQTVCVQSQGHTRKSRYWRGRGPLFRMATFLSLSPCLTQEQHMGFYKYVPVATTNFRAMFVHITMWSKNSHQGP